MINLLREGDSVVIYKLNAISIWNAVYLQAAYNYLVKIDPEVTKYMKHVSPINWEHITFLGEYKFDLLSIPKHLRELNIKINRP